jgi:8-oxo-dGTP diphosphatase
MRQSVAGIVEKNGFFLIGQRLSSGEMANRWEFPGGKVDPGETPEQALVREFREELNVDVIALECIGSAQFTNKNGISELLAFHVQFPQDADISLTEHTDLRWATFHEIEQLSFVDSDRLLFPAVKKWMQI